MFTLSIADNEGNVIDSFQACGACMIELLSDAFGPTMTDRFKANR